jgi:hypothetical protein
MGQLDDYKTFWLTGPGGDLSQYQEIPYHMVFDVKFNGRRKARLVAGGNKLLSPLRKFTLVLWVSRLSALFWPWQQWMRNW